VGCTNDWNCSNVDLSFVSRDVDSTAIVELRMFHLCSSSRTFNLIQSSPSRGARTVNISPICENAKMPGILSRGSDGQQFAAYQLAWSTSGGCTGIGMDEYLTGCLGPSACGHIPEYGVYGC
jgi:hypothetical protein